MGFMSQIIIILKNNYFLQHGVAEFNLTCFMRQSIKYGIINSKAPLA